MGQCLDKEGTHIIGANGKKKKNIKKDL